MNKLTLLLMAALSLAACTGENIPESASDPAKAKTIYLKREFQRVRRYDCYGMMISDRIETVRAPVETVELRPTGARGLSEISSSYFRNARTRSSPAIIDHVKFQVDYEDTAFNMKVRSGLNEIAYNFHFYDGSVESGSRFISVNYSEEYLDGVQDYHPSDYDCVQ